MTISNESRSRVKKVFEPIALGMGRLGLTPDALTLIGFGITVVGAILVAGARIDAETLTRARAVGVAERRDADGLAFQRLDGRDRACSLGRGDDRKQRQPTGHCEAADVRAGIAEGGIATASTGQTFRVSYVGFITYR